MGTIRLLLALSVVITHSAPIFGVTLLSGDVAVNSFFVVSGFLMALILQTRYVGKIRAFYINRILRIYPPYFVALAFSVAFFCLSDTRSHDPDKAWRWFIEAEAWGAIAWGALTNLTLIGINLVRYTNFTETGQFIINFLEPGGFGGHNILFVPQAWTLSLELYYYALVPFIVLLRTRYIAALTIGLFFLNIVALKFVVVRLGWKFSPDASFPFMLKYFLLGTLAYRFMEPARRLSEGVSVFRLLPAASLVAAFALIVFGITPFGRLEWFYVAFALCLPGMFIFSSRSQFDSAVGEYSYPVYLFHYPVTISVSMWLSQEWHGPLTVAITMLLATIYIWTIDRRIEDVRRRIARNGIRAGYAAEPWTTPPAQAPATRQP